MSEDGPNTNSTFRNRVDIRTHGPPSKTFFVAKSHPTKDSNNRHKQDLLMYEASQYNRPSNIQVRKSVKMTVKGTEYHSKRCFSERQQPHGRPSAKSIRQHSLMRRISLNFFQLSHQAAPRRSAFYQIQSHTGKDHATHCWYGPGERHDGQAMSTASPQSNAQSNAGTPHLPAATSIFYYSQL